MFGWATLVAYAFITTGEFQEALAIGGRCGLWFPEKEGSRVEELSKQNFAKSTERNEDISGADRLWTSF